MSQLTGLFGGTFDPVHCGHVHLVEAAIEQTSLDCLRVIPCQHPPHRAMPVASATQRLAMLRLALTPYPEVIIDTCELERAEPSYAFTTLSGLREQDSESAFCWLMGLDAFQGFAQWYRWQDILDLTHLLVVHRPGYQLQQSEASKALLEQRQVDSESALRQKKAGAIMLVELDAPDISATDVRQRLAENKSVSGVVPDNVITWLQNNPVYS